MSTYCHRIFGLGREGANRNDLMNEGSSESIDTFSESQNVDDNMLT